MGKAILAAAALLLLGLGATPVARAADPVPWYSAAPREVRFYPSIYFPGLEQLGQGWRTEGIVVNADTLARYVVELYRFLTAATAILALFMITYGGLLWLLAGGNQGTISHAKEVVTGAIAGMLVALLSYALLASISRGLVQFRSLDTRVPESTASPSTPTGTGGQDCTQPNFTQIINSSSLDATHGGAQYTCAGTQAVAALRRASDAVFDATRIQVSLKSSYRSLARQQELFQQNCAVCIRDHPSDWQQVCTSGMCHPVTCNPWKPSGCPHPSGRALDVQCKEQAQSWGDCQLMLERKMLDEGFCRLKSELWHFELPAASGANCITTQPNPSTGEREGCFRADGVTPCCNSKTGANCSFSGG